DAKGLYFINPDSSNTKKPTQLWTQGQPEANSCWFPTIDSPNERMTQEVFITLPESFKSLSNGTLVYSNYNADNTRTDYWKLDQPHPPYLAMLAAGNFVKAVQSYTKESGEEIPVEYFVEPEYANHVFNIFGNTPEMMSFYSEILGYDYPWDKYDQVVVRDYVSGAMENTTAVIHGDFVQRTTRELLDENYEDVIAHELFHHWFGDLVTCESWGHLPLNESFATYGEYLWAEHKYGKIEADYRQWESTQGYFYESKFKQVPLIRTDFANPDDMFDAHSYNKGGHILHMLRNYLGDEAFFSGLQTYLKQYEFQHAEADQLRIAMEKVCGKDLQWFFDQWFFGAGHPNVNISYFQDSEELQVVITQSQVFEDQQLFKLPIGIDLHFLNGEVEHKEVFMDQEEQIFTFALSDSLAWASVDSDKVLLWQKTDNKPDSWWGHQLQQSTLFLDQLEALDWIEKHPELITQEWIDTGASHEHGFIQMRTLEIIESLDQPEAHIGSISQIVDSTKDTETESYGIDLWYELDPNSASLKSAVLERLENDLSYYVLGSSLGVLSQISPSEAKPYADQLKDEDNTDIHMAVIQSYLSTDKEEGLKMLNNALENAEDFEQYELLFIYGDWVLAQSKEEQIEAVSTFENVARTGQQWWIRYQGYNYLAGIMNSLQSSPEHTEEAKKVEALLKELKEQEEDEQLLKYISE
ncbi:MAG: M1 family metallopeptidase, partial [Flavobacteriales bacterium]|nr:M1 family metallopeptidase [Flavobacteriales bacterium]